MLDADLMTMCDVMHVRMRTFRNTLGLRQWTNMVRWWCCRLIELWRFMIRDRIGVDEPLDVIASRDVVSVWLWRMWNLRQAKLNVLLIHTKTWSRNERADDRWIDIELWIVWHFVEAKGFTQRTCWASSTHVCHISFAFAPPNVGAMIAPHHYNMCYVIIIGHRRPPNRTWNIVQPLAQVGSIRDRCAELLIRMFWMSYVVGQTSKHAQTNPLGYARWAIGDSCFWLQLQLQINTDSVCVCHKWFVATDWFLAMIFKGYH